MADRSQRFNLVLSLIEDGSEWRVWADRLGIDLVGLSEAQQLEQIQVGLHGGPLVLIPQAGLLAHPVKLMELDETGLSALRHGGDAVTAELLDHYHLFDETALTTGEQFLDQLGIAVQGAQYAASLADRIALARLATEPLAGPRTLQSEAAAWAVTVARTGSELADYLRFYLAAGGSAATPSARSAAAEGLLATLRPYAFALLQCPVVEARDNVDDLLAELRKRLKSGQRLAFPTVASACRYLASQAGVAGLGGDALDRAVSGYLDRAGGIVIGQQPTATYASQDGHWMRIEFNGEGGRLELALDSEGCVVIDDFAPCGAAVQQAAA